MKKKPQKKEAQKIYTVDVELKLGKRPSSKKFILMGVQGKVIKSERCQDYWIVTVKFRADTMMALLAITDDRQLISKELH